MNERMNYFTENQKVGITSNYAFGNCHSKNGPHFKENSHAWV